MIFELKDLNIPFDQIKKQAKGDTTKELVLAASYGYRLACEDKTKFLKNT